MSSDKGKGHRDWNSPEFHDTTNSGGKKEIKAMVFQKMETEDISDRFVAPCFVSGLEAYDEEINLGVEENMISNEFVVKLCLEHDVKHIEGVNVPQFMCRIGKSSRNRRRQLEKYQLINSNMGPSMSTGIPLTQEEAEREALAISICERYSLPEEERHVIETMAYSDKYKKILDGIYTSLDINVIPYHIYKELGREEVRNVKKGILILNRSKAKPMGLRSTVLCQVGVTTIIAKFLILDMPIDRGTLILVRRGFLHTCGGILNTIDNITSTFNGICHQKLCVTKTSLDIAESDSDDEEDYAFQRKKFGAPIYRPKPTRYLNCNDPLDQSLALPKVMNPFRKICVSKKVTMEGNDDGARSSRSKHSRQYKTVKEVLIPQVHHNFWNGKVATEMQRQELCHEFYSTYKFDEFCDDDKLKPKKIIKFRLEGRAHSLTLLEFSHRLGLYHAEELDEEGFDVYFQGGLHSDEHFNA
nr:hypothetical protein [Tanacetum cinerariifolium]